MLDAFCPISDNRELDVRKLIPQCKKLDCWFLKSDLDDLPAGCTLLVALLLGKKKEEENRE